MISFSVVIPIYNSSEYIVEAIGSVLSQTILPKEIIIVDDFSDDCLEAFKKISHLKTEVIIRYIQHYENRNGSAARNTGIINSDGDYIAFLDADDVWAENKLEEMERYILSSDTNPKVIFNQARIIDQAECVKSIRPYRYHSTYIPEFLFIERGFIQTSCLVISSDLGVFFDETLKRHQDFQFCIDLCSEHNFHFISKPLTDYRLPLKDQLKTKESSDFSLSWIEGNKRKISHDSYYGFRAVVLTNKYIMEGNAGYAIYNFFINFYKIGFVNKLRLIYAIIKK